MKLIRKMAEQFPITETSEFYEIVATASSDLAQEYWRRRSTISNFLKHADRDPKSFLSVNDVDNQGLLMQAICAYLDITHDHPGPESLVFWVYINAVNGTAEGMPKQYRGLASKLNELDPDEQIRVCSKWLHEMKNVRVDNQ